MTPGEATGTAGPPIGGPARIRRDPERGPGAWLLTARTFLPLDASSVFEFFGDATNLGRITPPELRFEIVTSTPIEMEEGTLIDYRLRLFGIPFRWQTEISTWDPPHSFTDSQRKGPYREWIHTHAFRPVPGGVEMTDAVQFRLPLYPFSTPALPVVRLQLRRIFRYRQQRISTLLG